jgi:hypothetical protein
VAAAARGLPPRSILSVGKVIPETEYSRSTAPDDSTRLPLVARALGVPFDTITQSRLPACPTDTTARGAKGYRIIQVSLRLSYVRVNGASSTQHYLVDFVRMCRREYHAFYLVSTARIDAVPDTEFSYKWVVGNVETWADPPRDPELTFRQRHDSIDALSARFAFFGTVAFPILGLLAGFFGGRSALKWSLGIWCLAGFGAAAFVGMPSLVGWSILFAVPPSLYVALALSGVQGKPDSLAFGRATVTFVIAYVICFFLFWSTLLNS